MTTGNLHLHIHAPLPHVAVVRSSLYQGFEDSAQNKAEVGHRVIMRTPNPTPSEAKALSSKVRSCGFRPRRYFRLEWLKEPRNLLTLSALLLLFGLVIAFSILHRDILNAISPAVHWLKRTPGAWMIPIAVMIILSFPPLMGHELVAIFCGDVWGVWLGFGIVATGTILGELATYFTSRQSCTGRIEKAKKLKYVLLSEVVKEDGLKMAVMVRYSTVPAHLTTAVFASAGMPLQTFLLAALLALPKQLSSVYLGVADPKHVTTAETVTKAFILVLTVLVTVFAMWYVDATLNAAKERAIYARRKARQEQRTVYLRRESFGGGRGDVVSDMPVPVGAAVLDGFETEHDAL